MKRILIAALAVAGCKSSDLPKLDHGAEAVEITTPLTFHEREGFTALSPPAHVPSSDAAGDQVTIWLALGEGPITTTTLEGRSVLAWPEGTRADRVEMAGRGDARFIADIRGTTLTEDGPRFHVYRPSARQPRAPLFGARWPGDSAEAHAEATGYLAERIGKSDPVASWKPAARKAEVQGFRQKNACLPCHDPGRPDNERPGQHGIVNRGTDGSGFFTPATLFEDDVPLEQYGSFDHTVEDPLVDIRCGEEILSSTQRKKWNRRCDNGRAPRALWRWDRAWSQAPTRAKQRCAQAKWLFEHMDDGAREQVAHFFDNCANPHQD